MPDLFRSQEISDAPFAWTKEYGTVLRIHNEFSVSQYMCTLLPPAHQVHTQRKTLFMSDPKVIPPNVTSNAARLTS